MAVAFTANLKSSSSYLEFKIVVSVVIGELVIEITLSNLDFQE